MACASLTNTTIMEIKTNNMYGFEHLNKIHLGDCLEIMKIIPNGTIDMVLCDLPYGTTACKWDVLIPFDKLWEQYERIIKPNGAIILTASQPFTSILIQSKFNMFKYSMVWVKDKPSNFANANKMPMRYHEDICVFYNQMPTYNQQFEPRKGSGVNRVKYKITNGFGDNDQNEHKIGCKEQTKNYGDMKQVGTVLDVAFEVRKKGQHGTVKPIKLFELLIKMFTNEGDVVLDNCIGSGTTAISCKNTNRHFIGIEKEKEYFDMAEKRIEDWKPNLLLF
jgi:site-specific DNA-methyltransferase (adenine-specific)